MTTAVAVRPTLVETGIGASGAGSRCALDLRERTCELGNFLQGCDQFGICGGKSSRESAVGHGERCHRGAITGSGRGMVGNGVNSVFLIDVIGGLKSCTGRSGKGGFKSGTGLDLRGLELPEITVLEKQPCLENELESDAYDLLRRVGRVSSCRIFDGSFYLINDCFDGVVGVIGGA